MTPRRISKLVRHVNRIRVKFFEWIVSLSRSYILNLDSIFHPYSAATSNSDEISGTSTVLGESITSSQPSSFTYHEGDLSKDNQLISQKEFSGKFIIILILFRFSYVALCLWTIPGVKAMVELKKFALPVSYKPYIEQRNGSARFKFNCKKMAISCFTFKSSKMLIKEFTL